MALIESNRKYIRKCAENIVSDYRDSGPEKGKLLAELRSLTHKMIEAEQKVQDQQDALLKAETAVERFRREAVASPDPMTIAQLLKVHDDTLNEAMAQLKDDRRKKVAGHTDLVYLDNVIKAQGEEAAPPAAASGGDLELISSPSSLSLIDPITKRPMTQAVRHNKCGHVYDKASVLKMIKSSARFRCPYMGCACKDPLKARNLEPALDYQREIDQRAAP